jgi:hypothetical protein
MAPSREYVARSAQRWIPILIPWPDPSVTQDHQDLSPAYKRAMEKGGLDAGSHFSRLGNYQPTLIVCIMTVVVNDLWPKSTKVKPPTINYQE